MKLKKIMSRNLYKNLKLSFIGGGNITQAFTKGLLQSKILKPSQIIVSDPNKKQHPFFKKLGIKTTQCNEIATTNQDVIIFATKPNVLNDVFDELSLQNFNKSLVLSVIAGIKSNVFTSKLNLNKIIRVIPNTPCIIGEGMSIWYQHNCQKRDEMIAQKLLRSVGKEIKVDKESYINMATSLSGTGPSYIYLLSESMIDTGVHMGLSRELSREIVEQTLKGSVEYFIESNKHPVILRNEITSPGGTSAEALYYLENNRFRSCISKSIWAAYQRAIKINLNLFNHSI